MKDNYYNMDKVNEMYLNSSKEEFKNFIYDFIDKADLYKVWGSYYEFLNLFSISVADGRIIEILASKKLIDIDIERIFISLCSSDKKMAAIFLESVDISDSLVSKLVYDIVHTMNLDFLYENISWFLERYNNIVGLYNLVMDNDKCREIVQLYIDNNIDNIIGVKNIYYWEKLYGISSEKSKLYIVNFLFDNFNSLVKGYDNVFYLKKKIRNFDRLMDKFKDYVDYNFKEVLGRCFFGEDELEEYLTNDNSILDVLVMVFEEVCNNEKVKFSDIEVIGEGGYSTAFGISDKVIKVGRQREVFSFPNNPYIIQPVLRKKIKIDKKRELFVEVQERVKMLTDLEKKNKYFLEKLYELYKGIRELGLVWLDVSMDNVGILLKDNKRYWNEDLNILNEAIGFTNYRGNKLLKKGELVILDSDFIFEEDMVPDKYYEGDYDIKMYMEFEVRYQYEKRNRKKNIG